MSIRVSRRASMLAATTLALALGGAAPAARADLLGLGGNNCPDQQLTQPFAPWSDPASYFLVPGGTFELGSVAWDTSGDAGVAAGNEPWFVNDSGDGNSMALPPGSSATSPRTCVSLTSPTLRFFARSSGGSPGSSLGVEVLFKTTAGVLSSLPIASVPASGDWKATPPYLLVANVLTLLGGDYDFVAFRFTPQGDATWQIDDLYIDPWSKG